MKSNRITRRAILAATPLLSLRAADVTKMIVRSPNPEDMEMKLSGFTEAITPIDQFFVRGHTYIPNVDASQWTLKIDGKVDRPLTLSMADLKKLPRVELVSVLECAGNGRSFYEPRMPGAQWAYGAVGNGKWAGVRLKDVLEKAGIQSSAVAVLMDGADVPLGKMPDFQRTLPREKALHPDTLLAYSMNGQDLPREHGFPLRVIVPGWAGDSWVKWLQHIEVLDHEFDGFWMKSAYRHPPAHVAPGTAVDAANMVPVTDLAVKSVIATPDGWTKPGRVRIQGVAWSNTSPVSKVDVSTDGGKTWNAAKFANPSSKYGWRVWQFDWAAKEGKYSLLSRATNAAGVSQPTEPEWNPSGYLFNGIQSYLVTVSGSAPAPVPESPATQSDSPAAYKAACLACHDEHMMTQQHLTRAQWDREITKMTGWGAQVDSNNHDAILEYLANRFK